MYLLDLAPSDYHLISSLKHDLDGRYFALEEDLHSTVTEFFAKQDAEWYSADIHKLILRYSKCLDELGEYVRGAFNNYVCGSDKTLKKNSKKFRKKNFIGRLNLFFDIFTK